MKHVQVSHHDSVYAIELARPEKRNAFNAEMIADVKAAFQTAGQSGARVVVLSGQGETFCAGGDLEWMKSTARFSKSENEADALALYDMFEAVRLCPLPVIGRAQGHAMGGGLGLLAACDIVAAEEKTQFSFSEVKIGLVPAVISSFVLEKMTPHKAREWMLTGRLFSAVEASAAGLVHLAATLDKVDLFIAENVKAFQKAGPEAVRETKKLLRDLSGLSPSQYRTHTTRVIAERRVSAEGQEGLKSFLEKRSPKWP